MEQVHPVTQFLIVSLRTDIAEIRIFSRDEKKQDDMRHECQVKFPDVAQIMLL